MPGGCLLFSLPTGSAYASRSDHVLSNLPVMVVVFKMYALRVPINLIGMGGTPDSSGSVHRPVISVLLSLRHAFPLDQI